MGLNIVARIVLDVSVFVIIGLSVVYLKIHGIPFKRGYFLNDDSIKYPYKAVEAIDFKLLVVTVTVLPTITILIIEVCIHYLAENRFRRPSKPIARLCIIPGFLVSSYQYIGMFWIGTASTELSVEIPRLITGRLRPYFLDVCHPNTTTLNTTDGYIYADICSGRDIQAINDARLSFPSSHSSMTMFPAVYLAVYFSHRLLQAWAPLRMPTLLVGCGLVNLAIYVGCTRISDNRHHWSDVVTGMLLGAFVALVMSYVYGSGPFGGKTATSTSVEHSDDNAETYNSTMFRLPNKELYQQL